MNRPILGLVASAALVSACTGAFPRNGPRSERDHGNAIVLDTVEIGPTKGTILMSIQSRVTNMRVIRHGECPDIEMRGRKSLTMPTPPGIYVEGQRAANTCILEQLDPAEVTRVEVYPTGVTTRPGYVSQVGGLILVFLRDGNS